MANSFQTAACALLCALTLSGCVCVYNHDGLQPPSAFCSHLSGTVGVPKCPLPIGEIRKSGKTGTSVIVKEWIFSGASVDVLDMTLRRAIENGGLKKVYYADYDQTSYLGFVTLFSVTAYGE